MLLFTERLKIQVRAHVTTRIGAMRGVSPSLELPATSDGSRRLDRDFKMENKEVIESAQDPLDQGCCQEGQQADEEWISTGGSEEANVNKSRCEEGKVESRPCFNPDSLQQSPHKSPDLLNGAYQTGVILICVQPAKSS